jgi:hypothetical protein
MFFEYISLVPHAQKMGMGMALNIDFEIDWPQFINQDD